MWYICSGTAENSRDLGEFLVVATPKFGGEGPLSPPNSEKWYRGGWLDLPCHPVITHQIWPAISSWYQNSRNIEDIAWQPRTLDVTLDFAPGRPKTPKISAPGTIFPQNINFLIYTTTPIASVCLCNWLPLLRGIMSPRGSFNQAWTEEAAPRSSASLWADEWTTINGDTR